LDNSILNKVEPFISSQIQNYELISIKASDLLTWNRLDLAFKLFYLDSLNFYKPIALEVYKHDIRSQTLEQFSEFANDSKNDFESYVKTFNEIFNDIKENGFSSKKSIIPISNNSTILNGAHRTASLIFLKREAQCIKTDLKSITCDYKYFYERKVPYKVLDIVVQTFIEFSHNTHIAFLWPSGSKLKPKQVDKFFKKIIYKKKIRLNSNGAFNLLIELYKHMDWSGNNKNKYYPVANKLVECFKSFDFFDVVVFQSNSLKNVIEIKEKIRSVLGNGYSSIHITDTIEEATRISRLIFNENAINFLNLSKPYYFKTAVEDLEEKLTFFKKSNIDPKRALVLGDSVSNLMGARNKNKFEILYDSMDNNESNSSKIHLFLKNDIVLRVDTKKKIIHDPNYYFWYNGLKFLSLDFSSNLSEDSINGKLQSSKKNKNSYKQNLFYLKVKLKNDLNRFLFKSLKFFKLYNLVRFIYRKLKKV
jgi:hypothetical protein